MRCFEKISFEQFSKDICNDRDLYDSFCDEFKMKAQAFVAILDQYESEDEVDEELELVLEQNLYQTLRTLL